MGTDEVRVHLEYFPQLFNGSVVLARVPQEPPAVLFALDKPGTQCRLLIGVAAPQEVPTYARPERNHRGV
jgi:hypothetical protein